jgi:DNA-directed RNA polymerase subunit N (RpoN/RPB10)
MIFSCFSSFKAAGPNKASCINIALVSKKIAAGDAYRSFDRKIGEIANWHQVLSSVGVWTQCPNPVFLVWQNNPQ